MHTVFHRKLCQLEYYMSVRYKRADIIIPVNAIIAIHVTAKSVNNNISHKMCRKGCVPKSQLDGSNDVIAWFSAWLEGWALPRSICVKCEFHTFLQRILVRCDYVRATWITNNVFVLAKRILQNHSITCSRFSLCG